MKFQLELYEENIILTGTSLVFTYIYMYLPVLPVLPVYYLKFLKKNIYKKIQKLFVEKEVIQVIKRPFDISDTYILVIKTHFLVFLTLLDQVGQLLFLCGRGVFFTIIHIKIPPRICFISIPNFFYP